MTAVPALKRGLEILELLNRHESLSLEQIAGETKYPKASILRMLETMGEMGLILRQREAKTYRALSLIMPRENNFKQRLRDELHALAEKCDACVEWYKPEKHGMRIMQRYSAPENEVQVHARVGFIRPWFKEVEAVALCALAFGEKQGQVPANADLWSYDAEGEHGPISLKDLSSLTDQAVSDRITCDKYYNDNGVKRMAAPIFQDDQLFGIVALAMSFRPQLEKHLPEKQKHLLYTQCQLHR